MKFITPCLAILLVLMVSSCNAEITGTVVDAETGRPIEGAVVLIQWTKTKGMPGMTHHEVHKVIEMETLRNGEFSVSEIINPLVNNPEIVIYKESYVAWRNDIIFPSWQVRKDFKLSKDMVIKLEKFKASLSRYDHYGFLIHGIIGANNELTPKFSKTSNDELKKALYEKK